MLVFARGRQAVHTHLRTCMRTCVVARGTGREKRDGAIRPRVKLLQECTAYRISSVISPISKLNYLVLYVSFATFR